MPGGFESTKLTLFHAADLIFCGRNWQKHLLEWKEKNEIFEDGEFWKDRL